MIKTRVNVKPFGEEISQKFDHLHIHGLNLLKFAFSIFNLNFLNIHQKNKEFFDKKLDQILSYVIKTLFQNLIV
jgi:hypothetical protein